MAALTIAGQNITPKQVVCKLGGDLDADGFDRLEDEFGNYLNAGVLGLVLDLTALDSFCSSGMGAILEMASALAERGGKLVLASPRPKVQGTIEMLGLQEKLPVADNMDAARKLLAGIAV